MVCQKLLNLSNDSMVCLDFWLQVDEEVGLNHLFKRSVILVKAWCYYESRILGAHHGLISTFALETLVLYIFHVFHSMRSLHGPLEVGDLMVFLSYLKTLFPLVSSMRFYVENCMQRSSFRENNTVEYHVICILFYSTLLRDCWRSC